MQSQGGGWLLTQVMFLFRSAADSAKCARAWRDRSNMTVSSQQTPCRVCLAAFASTAAHWRVHSVTIFRVSALAASERCGETSMSIGPEVECPPSGD